jgi:hypothetical protein
MTILQNQFFQGNTLIDRKLRLTSKPCRYFDIFYHFVHLNLRNGLSEFVSVYDYILCCHSTQPPHRADDVTEGNRQQTHILTEGDFSS